MSEQDNNTSTEAASGASFEPIKICNLCGDLRNESGNNKI